MKKTYDLFSKYNIVFILIIIIFCSNLVTKSLLENIRIKSDINSLNNAQSIKFQFSNSENINTDIIIKEIEEIKNITSLEADNIVFHIPGDVIYGKAIYLKFENNEIPILSGRFFNIDDIKNYSNTVVLGKNLDKYSLKEGNKKYIFIVEKKLEVVGIMGTESKRTSYDDTFFVNLSGFILPNPNLESLYTYKIRGIYEKKDLNKIIKDVCDKYNVKSLEYISSKENLSIGEIIDSIYIYMPLIIIVFIFIGINLLDIFRFWWQNNKNKFILNRMVGATKVNIVQMAIQILFKKFMIAMIATYILNFLSYNFISKFFPNYNFDNNLLSPIITSLILFILCICISIMPVYKLLNKEINKNIRGI